MDNNQVYFKGIKEKIIEYINFAEFEILIAIAWFTDKEIIKFRDLAAIARGAVPSDILDYFNGNEALRNAIRRAKDKGLTNTDWEKLIK